MYICSFSYPEFKVREAYVSLWPARLHNIFFTLSYKWREYGEKVTKCKFGVFFSTILSKMFLILRRIQQDITTNTLTSSRKVSVILVRFLGILKFHDRVSNKTRIRNFIKIRPVWAELFHADKRIDTTKLVVVFGNSANTSEKSSHWERTAWVLTLRRDITAGLWNNRERD